MRAIISGNTIQIKDGYLFKESIKAIDGRQYDPASKTWIIPLTDANVALLSILGAEFDESAEILKDTAAAISDEPAVVCMPIKATPYKHQVAAFNFALRIFGGAI